MYARVSSGDQTPDLDRQIARLSCYAAEHEVRVLRVVGEVGSGLNGHRPRLQSLLRDPKIGLLIVEHRDRLARFGSEYIEAALAASGCRLVVVDPEEMKDALVQDMIDVLTSFVPGCTGAGRQKPGQAGIYLLLDAIAALYGRAERALSVDRHGRGRALSECKRESIKGCGLTARQFNAVRVNLDGTVEAVREGQKPRIAHLQAAIKSAQQAVRQSCGAGCASPWTRRSGACTA